MAVLDLALLGSTTRTISAANADATNLINVTALSGRSTIVVDGVGATVQSVAGVAIGSQLVFQAQNGGSLTINENLLNISALTGNSYVVAGNGSIALNGADVAVGLAAIQNVTFTGAEQGSFTFATNSLLASPITFNVNGIQRGDTFTVANTGTFGVQQQLGLDTSGGAAYRGGILHLSSGTGIDAARDVYVRVPLTQEQYNLFSADPGAFLSGQQFRLPGPQYGTEAGETISGTGVVDIIYGGPNDSAPEVDTGNDTILAGDGADTVYAGDGADRVEGGLGADVLFGGVGNDTLLGEGGADSIVAGAGEDLLFGGDGNDTLNGGTENDTIVGGAGADSLIGGAGADFVDYSGSATAVTVSLSSNSGLRGDAAGDSLAGFEGIIGSAGADILTGGTAGETLFGGAGADTLTGNAGADLLNGGSGDDAIFGGPGADTLAGGAGADGLFGGGDFDIADYSGAAGPVALDLGLGSGSVGDAAGDTLSGIEGVLGSAFDDTLLGSGAADSLVGGDGADSLSGLLGNDTLAGGLGGDTMRGGAGNDSLLGQEGDDSLFGDTGADVLDGGAGDDRIDGGAGNDTLTGAEGQDTLLGGEGTDQLFGGLGNDSLDGGGGGDTIDGGAGDDVIRGDGPTATAPPSALSWSAQGAEGTNLSGGFVQSAGGMNVAFSYSAPIPGPGATVTTAAQYTGGAPATSGLLLTSFGAGPETAALDFSSATEGLSDNVGNVSFRLNDLDGAAGTGAYLDRVQVTAFDAAGNPVPVTMTPLGSDTVAGQTVTAALGSDDPDTAGGSVGVSIAGPVARIELRYDSAAGTGQRFLYLTDVQFSPQSITEGADTIAGGDGADTIYGEGGADLIDGGAGDDALFGGAGADTVIGGAGNDRILFGTGDSVDGGADDDTFAFDPETGPLGSVTVAGGTGSDALDLRGLGAFGYADLSSVTEDGITSWSGTAAFASGGTIAFTGIESLICFTAGTTILTGAGPRPVEDLRAGDGIVTRDNGIQAIRWIGRRTVLATGPFAPVTIAAGALPGLDRALRVSQQHRMLLCGLRAEVHFGASEVLVAAKHMVDGGRVVLQDDARPVTYIHILFDGHEIVFANGAATESFHPGAGGLSGLQDECRDELFALFPDLRSSLSSFGPTARRVLRGYEAQVLGL